MEEIFDVVDENDVVTGSAPRRAVHAQGLLHRAVHILVFNAKGEFFLQKRSMTKDQCPGLWSTSCAGHVDRGEEYDSAAVREFGEEMGIPAPALERLFKLPPSRATGNEHVWIYRCHCEGPFRLDPGEIDDGKWMAAEPLTRSIGECPEQYTPAMRLIWVEYCRRMPSE